MRGGSPVTIRTKIKPLRDGPKLTHGYQRIPAKDGLGPHELDGLRPCAHETYEQDEEAALVRAKGPTLQTASCHDELLTQPSVLGDQLRARPSQVPEKSSDQRAGAGHRAQLARSSARRAPNRAAHMPTNGLKPRTDASRRRRRFQVLFVSNS